MNLLEYAKGGLADEVRRDIAAQIASQYLSGGLSGMVFPENFEAVETGGFVDLTLSENPLTDSENFGGEYADVWKEIVRGTDEQKDVFFFGLLVRSLSGNTDFMPELRKAFAVKGAIDSNSVNFFGITKSAGWENALLFTAAELCAQKRGTFEDCFKILSKAPCKAEIIVREKFTGEVINRFSESFSEPKRSFSAQPSYFSGSGEVYKPLDGAPVTLYYRVKPQKCR